MRSILRLLLAIAVGLLFAGSCLADTGMTMITSAGGATGTNESLSSYYGGGLSQSPSICSAHSESSCAQSWHETFHPYGGLVWDSSSFQPSMLRRENGAADNAPQAPLFDAGADPMSWTAADQMIPRQALDPGHEYGSWLNPRFGGSQVFDSGDSDDDFDHRHPPHDPHHPRDPHPTRHPHPPSQCGDTPPPLVPEPSTLPLVAGGLLLLGGLLRKRIWIPRTHSSPAA